MYMLAADCFYGLVLMPQFSVGEGLAYTFFISQITATDTSSNPKADIFWLSCLQDWYLLPVPVVDLMNISKYYFTLLFHFFIYITFC